MPSYNHGRFIKDALMAILNQSYPPIEIIIIDDCSTDNSIEIIKEFQKTSPIIKLIKNEKNRGVLYSETLGCRLAVGDYFHGAAADDIILQDFYKKSIEMFIKYPQAGVCSSLSLLIDENGKDKGLFPTSIPSDYPTYFSPDEVRKKLDRYGGWFIGNTAIYNRKLSFEVGFLNPELKHFADGFLMHALSVKYGACYIPEPLSCWRVMATGYASSTNRDTQQIEEIIQKSEWLMLSKESPFYGLFTKKYVSDWKKRQLYWRGIATLDHFNKEVKKFITDFSTIQSHLFQEPLIQTFLDRLIHSINRIIFKSYNILIKCYLIIRSATWPCSLLMTKWLWYNFKYKIKSKSKTN